MRPSRSERRWFCLEYASEELKKEQEVVKAVVQQYGDALRLASEELKKIKKWSWPLCSKAAKPCAMLAKN